MYSVTAHDVTGGASPVAPTESNKQTITNDTTQNVESTTAPEETRSIETKKAETDQLSPRFAALARQQKILRSEQRKIEELKQSLAKEREEIDKYRSWKDRLNQDTLGVLNEAGINYDKITQDYLSQGSPESQQILNLQKQIADLKANQEKSLSKFDEVQTQQYEQAKKQIHNDVTMLIDGNESYETIKAMGAEEAVVELIEQTYNDTGMLMDLDKAANEVEEYLLEEALKIARLKKIQGKLNPVNTQKPQQSAPSKAQKPQINTLSHRAVENTPKRSSSDRERKERAIAAFLGQNQ